MTERSRHLLASSAVTPVLVLSIYFGLSNARDITNTITIWQRLVGVTATAYGLAALPVLYALWLRRAWLWPVTLLWAGLVVGTAVLATLVYAGMLWTNVLAGLVALVLVAPVVEVARRRRPRAPAAAIVTPRPTPRGRAREGR